jgi:NADPH-dependent curcumin reductase CurA
MEAALKAACPDGIDVFFDMVGSATLDSVLPLLNIGARVIVVGTAATGAWVPPPLGPRLERTVLVKRCSLQGFLVFDWADEFEPALAELGGMVADGMLVYVEEVRKSLGAAPQALEDLYTGANTGKVIVQL